MAKTNEEKSLLNSSQDEMTVFVDQQSTTTSLKCPLCHQLFRDPTVTQCGHTFCRKCISVSTACPYDQQYLHQFASNRLVAEQIDSLLVWCKYAFRKIQSTTYERDDQGCSVKISWGRKREHEDECIYRFVPCPNGCPIVYLRQKDVQQHLSICPNRELKQCDNHVNDDDRLRSVQHELVAKMAQIDLLTTTCTQLNHAVTTMRAEMDILRDNQDDLRSRNDLLLSELMKMRRTSSIPTTVDEQGSGRTHDSDVEIETSTIILRCNGTFTGHSETVWCLHALDDVLLSGSGDTTVKVWNLRETPYTNLATLHGHTDGVLSLNVKDRTVFSGSIDKSIFVWNLDTYEKTSSFIAHVDPVCSLTHFDNHLYSSSNKCLKVWDMQTLELIDEISTDIRNGWLRVLMQHDKHIYAGCRRVIKVFDVITHQLVREFELPTNDSIYSLAHSSTVLFAGTLPGTIYMWDIRTNRRSETTCHHESAVHGLSILSSEKMKLVSASSDQTIRVWDGETLDQIQCDDRHEAEVTALHANARHIMSGATDAKIKVWDCVSPNDCFE